MEQSERPMRREHAGGDSIGQAKRVIDLIEQRINEGGHVLLKKDKCVVDQGELIDLISQLRIVLPKTVLQAQEIMQRSEKIVSDAKAEADKIAGEAKKYHQDAVESAEKTCSQIRAEADAYSQQVTQQAQEAASAAVADAQARAEQILYAAQMQAQQMVDENEITRRAQAAAMELHERAQADAASIYKQAWVHADKILSGAAAALTYNAGEIAKKRDALLGQESGPEDPLY